MAIDQQCWTGDAVRNRSAYEFPAKMNRQFATYAMELSTSRLSDARWVGSQTYGPTTMTAARVMSSAGARRRNRPAQNRRRSIRPSDAELASSIRVMRNPDNV